MTKHKDLIGVTVSGHRRDFAWLVRTMIMMIEDTILIDKIVQSRLSPLGFTEEIHGKVFYTLNQYFFCLKSYETWIN